MSAGSQSGWELCGVSRQSSSAFGMPVIPERYQALLSFSKRKSIIINFSGTPTAAVG